MSHWYIQDRLASERRADLDREADRDALMRSARGGKGSPTLTRRILLELMSFRRRGLEIQLKLARRQVEMLERALQTTGTD
jgi:hypothetical protein